MEEFNKTFLEKIADIFSINKKFLGFKQDFINFNPCIITSPVQARLIDFGEISGGKITSKNKKKIYLKELIGDSSDLFSNGFFFNFYLSPGDKHYWRTPSEGKFTCTKINKGKAKIPIFIGLEKIFKNHDFFEKAIRKNASIGSIFQTEKFPIAMIAVGSLCVNGIHITYQENKFCKKGEMCGYFTIGSSMLLCFPTAELEILIKKGEKVNIGQPIVKIKI